MTIPKSVIKIRKGNVKYISNVDRVNYTIRELIIRALNDAGKYIITKTRYDFKTSLSKLIKNRKMDKRLFNAFQWWVRKKEGDLILGIKVFPNNKNPSLKATRVPKRGGKKKNQLWYAEGQELGTGGMQRYGLLIKTVEENVNVIREIQSKYLSAINDEAKAIQIIEEDMKDETS